jgi:hypoxanthine phosphoribosyltransferase
MATTERVLQPLISADRIRERVAELADAVNRDYAGQPITLLGVLIGSLMFLADLARQLQSPSRIGFIRASSYRGEQTEPGELLLDANMVPDVGDRHVLIVDDILDSGNTLAKVLKHVRGLEPRSLRVAVLLHKQSRQQVPLTPDYCGFEIPDAFVVGYGLDFNDEYRQLPYIAILDQQG